MAKKCAHIFNRRRKRQKIDSRGQALAACRYSQVRAANRGARRARMFETATVERGVIRTGRGRRTKATWRVCS
jgi:hypothetical protein